MVRKKKLLLFLGVFTILFFGTLAIKSNQVSYLLLGLGLCLGLLVTYYFWKDN